MYRCVNWDKFVRFFEIFTIELPLRSKYLRFFNSKRDSRISFQFISKKEMYAI